MNNGPAAREPPKPKAILATPLNVEESRAQRQQRSQARFRDRGGIFVPSNRNTLADILLGKAEPLKKPRRSVSASPLGHLHKGPSVTQLRRISSPTKRTTPARKGSRSPQKQSRKSNQGGGRAETIIERPHSQSPQKLVRSASTVKSKSKPAAKPPKAKVATVSKKTHIEDESGHDTDAAPSKPKPKARSKDPSKSSKFLQEVLEETGDDTVPLKSMGKITKTAKSAKTKAQKLSDKPIENPKPKPSKPPPRSSKHIPDANPTEIASSSTASKSITKPRRSRAKTSDLYSGASEDEYVPKPPKSRPKPTTKAQASTTKTSDEAKGAARPPLKQMKTSGNLSDILEEDEDEEEEAPRTRNSSPPRQVSAKKSRASTSENPKRVESTKGKKHLVHDLSEDEEHRQPSTKQTKGVGVAGKHTNSNAKAISNATPSEAVKSKKRSVREDNSELDDSQPPTKRSKAALDKGSSSRPILKSKSKAATAVAKSKKRSISEDESPDESTQPPAKRAKAAANDQTTASSNSNAKSSKSKTAALRKEAAAKKRPFEQDDDTILEKADKDKRSTKRKKPLSGNEDATQTTKAPAKASKAKRGDSKSKKPPSKVAKPSSSRKAAETAGLKENTTESGKAAANAVSKRGPPKSVLERLKARDEPHIIDNDPDPIDFLS